MIKGEKKDGGKDRKLRTQRAAATVLALVMLGSALTGCGEAPGPAEEPTTQRAPIDTRKTARNLVEKAEKGAAVTADGEPGEAPKLADYTTDDAKVTEGQTSGMKEIDHFKTGFASGNHLMKVEADAPVKVSECDAYPILSVTRATIDDEMLKKTKEALIGDAKLYDGTRLYDSYVEQVLARGEKPDPEWKLGGQVPYAEVTGYPVDTKLVKVKEDAEKKRDLESYTDYYMQLMPEGELFYGVSDAKDGTYGNLTVTNSKRYGSSLKFFKSRDYNVRSGLVLPGLNIVSWPVEKGEDYVYNEEKNPNPAVGMPVKMTEVKGENGETEWQGEGNTPDPDFKGCTTRISDKETNAVSKEDAIRQAEELLKKIGLDGEYAPTVVTEDYFTDPQHLNDGKDADGKYGYEFLLGKAWHIVFQRTINGNVLEDYGEKYSYNHKGSKYVWFGEGIEVYVNDNGIIGFSFSDPLKVEETVVENGKLLDFAEIGRIYEKSQLEALNQSTMFDSILSLSEEDAKQSETPHYSFKVDDISLRYTRVTEKEEFERALLVPVWSFSGTCFADGKPVTEGSFLEINAVDGTVYNSTIGN